ncbi:MAG: hypothetical protein QOG17_1922 [Gammaproteobacteria bacterium]|nr:hypothetical protein [Gammaproteobacteria bacterium]
MKAAQEIERGQHANGAAARRWVLSALFAYGVMGAGGLVIHLT